MPLIYKSDLLSVISVDMQPFLVVTWLLIGHCSSDAISQSVIWTDGTAMVYDIEALVKYCNIVTQQLTLLLHSVVPYYLDCSAVCT
jgi:hypothetical protein